MTYRPNTQKCALLEKTSYVKIQPGKTLYVIMLKTLQEEILICCLKKVMFLGIIIQIKFINLTEQ